MTFDYVNKLQTETLTCHIFRYEPPPVIQYHFSTLVQQTLSTIGQYGGVRASQLWSLLCGSGPFSLVDQKLYGKFLKALGERDLITQTHDGQLVLGYKGECMVEHYTFYSAFNTPEEYRLEHNGRLLGTLPIDKPLVIGEHIVFAGKRWKILGVNAEKKIVALKKAKGGRPPKFGGHGQMVHDIVRQEMRRIYMNRESPVYMDKASKFIFDEGSDCFHDLQLDKSSTLHVGNSVHLLPWMGDRITNTITLLLRMKGLDADCYGGVIEISNSSIDTSQQTARAILNEDKPTPTELANLIKDTIVEKHDLILPKEIRTIGYGARFFDVDGAWKWLLNLHS